MKDTARIILFLECQMSCSYCCNEQSQFNEQFIRTAFKDLDLSRYSNVCLSGGEPFLHKERMYDVLSEIPRDKAVYIYSNGLRISWADTYYLSQYPHFKGLNIGLHTLTQLKKVHFRVDVLPVRYLCQDVNYDKLLEMYPNRLNPSNLKPWVLNECNRDNEDWYLLTDWLTPKGGVYESSN